MMTRRLTTPPSSASSLRFYKIITFIFLLATISLLGVIIFFTSKRATITVVTEEETKPFQISATVSTGANSSQSSIISGTVTSTTFFWSETYKPVGTKTVEGTSKGSVTIFNTTAAPITLIPKTRFVTEKGILFRLKNRVTIPAKGSLSSEVYADQNGAASDISPSNFTLPGLPAETQKLIYAESTEPMTGGSSAVGVLTSEDVSTAEVNYKEKVKEAFLKNKDAAPQGFAAYVSVVESVVQPSQQVGTEAKEFALSGTSTLVVIYYNPEHMQNAIQTEISKQINSDNEKLLPLEKEPTISLSSYDLSSGSAVFSVSQDVLATIDETAEKLQPNKFLGMKREEIEEYVKALPHVAGVEIKLSPLWAHSAPESSDKIKVLVKSVK